MRTLLLVAAFLASGCMSMDDDSAAAEQRITYSCDRGPGVTVVYAGETARIESADGQSVTLSRRKSGSGFWYESPTHTIRGDDREILYTVGRATPMMCRAG